MKAYTAKNGKRQFMPSIEEAMELDENGLGFCLACGEHQEAEPDVSKDVCRLCGAAKVYGAAELALMGLVY